MDEDQLKMLWHEYDTNVNEAMNRSVSSFAPKDRIFCRTMSLETRISIAAGVQICGHYKFWSLVLEKHGIIIGDSMKLILLKRDKENKFRNEYRKKKEVKKKRKHGDNTKISKGIAERKNQIRSGVYKSGIAINTEQKAKEMVCKLKERVQKKNQQ